MNWIKIQVTYSSVSLYIWLDAGKHLQIVGYAGKVARIIAPLYPSGEIGNLNRRMKMDWYKLVWKKYAEFEGRSRRKEYWMFTLFNSVIIFGVMMISAVLSAILGIAAGSGDPSHRAVISVVISVIMMGICVLYCLAIMIPSLACAVRRLHDTGKSGWLLLIGLIPLGGLVVLIFMMLDSNPGPNMYGPNPKEAVLPPAVA
jgi:uncharacterized membrane protein YhaH (DUF805 family)